MIYQRPNNPERGQDQKLRMLSLWVFSCSVVSNSLQPHSIAHQAPLSMDSPGKNTGVGSHSRLWGIFPQRLNLSLLHCRQILYHLSHRDLQTLIFSVNSPKLLVPSSPPLRISFSAKIFLRTGAE